MKLPRVITHTLGTATVEAGDVVFRRSVPAIDAPHVLWHALDLLRTQGVTARVSVEGYADTMATVTTTMPPGTLDRLVSGVRRAQRRLVREAVAAFTDARTKTHIITRLRAQEG